MQNQRRNIMQSIYEAMKNEERRRNALRLVSEMEHVANLGDRERGVAVLMSYLLYKCSKALNGGTISYKELFGERLGLDENLACTLKDYLSEEKWEMLVPLLGKYTAEDFSLAVFSGIEYAPARAEMEETPRALVKLSEKLLDIRAGDKVADLCSGVGGFLTAAAADEPDAEYYGYELNGISKLITDIRAELLGVNVKNRIRDVFVLPEDSTMKYDKIFSNYPFGVRMRKHKSGEHLCAEIAKECPEARMIASDWVFNEAINRLLKENGRAVAIMTSGSTWNVSDKAMRKYFADRGFIEAVITLPSKLFSYSFISTSILVMSRGNTSIRLVDASTFCKESLRGNELTDEDIEKIMDAMKEDGAYSKTIDLAALRENDYTLSLGRYSVESIHLKNPVPFSTVIKRLSRGSAIRSSELKALSSTEPTNMRYLMLTNIKGGVIDEELPYLSKIDVKQEKYCLNNNDLILSKIGVPHKIAVASVKEGQQILASGNLYIIEIDEEKADPYYLKAFFESERGSAILKSITRGVAIQTIAADDLKNIRIPLLPMETQKRIARKYCAGMDEIAILKRKIARTEERLHGVFDEECEE